MSPIEAVCSSRRVLRRAAARVPPCNRPTNPLAARPNGATTTLANVTALSLAAVRSTRKVAREQSSEHNLSTEHINSLFHKLPGRCGRSCCHCSSHVPPPRSDSDVPKVVKLCEKLEISNRLKNGRGCECHALYRVQKTTSPCCAPPQTELSDGVAHSSPLIPNSESCFRCQPSQCTIARPCQNPTDVTRKERDVARDRVKQPGFHEGEAKTWPLSCP